MNPSLPPSITSQPTPIMEWVEEGIYQDTAGKFHYADCAYRMTHGPLDTLEAAREALRQHWASESEVPE